MLSCLRVLVNSLTSKYAKKAINSMEKMLGHTCDTSGC